MSEMTEQEFWEWCGFKLERVDMSPYPEENNYGTDITYPNGKVERFPLDLATINLTYPIMTLDNLFKYAWPELVKQFGLYSASLTLMKWILDWYKDWKITDPVQALYQAICKVIEGDER